MLIGKPRSIFNPYEWLPGYGESGVYFHSRGLDVFLEVVYEREAPDGDGHEAISTLTRETVSYTHLTLPTICSV